MFGLFGKEETRFRLIQAPSEGGRFERRVYQVLQQADTGDGTVSPKELGAFFRRTSNWGLAHELAAIPRKAYQDQHGSLLDPASSRRGVAWAIGLGIAGLLDVLAGVFTVPFGLEVFGRYGYGGPSGSLVVLAVALGAVGLGLLVLALVAYASLPRWQPEKLLNARRWAAYHNFLADFSQMEQAPAEHFKLWDYHFVYAAALGVAERYLRNLRHLVQTQQQPMVIPLWVGGPRGDLTGTVASVSQLTQVAQSLEQVTRNLNNLQSALNPRSGFGGGFGGRSIGGASGGGSSSGAR